MNYSYHFSQSGNREAYDVHPKSELLSMLQMANLKHKLVSLHPGGVHAKAPGGGSLTSSMEQALLDACGQHVVRPQMGCILPAVEWPGELSVNFQSQLSNNGHLEQNSDVFFILSPTTDSFSSNAPPQYKSAMPGVVNGIALPTSDMCHKDSTPGLGGRLLEVEFNGGMALPDISGIFMESGKKMLTCTLDSHLPAVHSTRRMVRTSVDHFQDFLSPLSPVGRPDYRQQAGFTSASHSQQSYGSWSSEVCSRRRNLDKSVDVEAGVTCSGIKNASSESGLFLDCLCKTPQQTCASHNVIPDTQDNLITPNYSRLGERKSFLDHYSKECQASRSVYQQKTCLKTNKVSVLDDIHELVEGVHQNINRSKSFTISPVFDNFQDRHNLGKSPTIEQGLNHVSLAEKHNHHVLQHKIVKADIEGKVISNESPLLNLWAMELDRGQGLGMVHGIPQIEVRMLENKQMMIKIRSKDRCGLFSDVMLALQDLQLQVEYANIRTIFGCAQDVFTAKVNVTVTDRQTTSDIAEAMRQAIEKGATPPSRCPSLASPDVTLPSLSS